MPSTTDPNKNAYFLYNQALIKIKSKPKDIKIKSSTKKQERDL